jgi:hypothetical protein
LRRLADGEPCSFQSPHGWPTIQFVSGCDGSYVVRPGGPTAAELDGLTAEGDRVFVILKRSAPRASSLGTRTPVIVERPHRPWFVDAWP